MAYEQSLWRLVHEVGAAKCLDAERLGGLRWWAADRARNLAAAVFDDDGIRASFRVALGHAADELIAGRQPE